MATFNVKFNEDSTFKMAMNEGENLRAGFGEVQIVETGNYDNLSNKPSIEDVTLQGNKTFKQLGLEALTVQEVQSILYNNERRTRRNG